MYRHDETHHPVRARRIGPQISKWNPGSDRPIVWLLTGTVGTTSTQTSSKGSTKNRLICAIHYSTIGWSISQYSNRVSSTIYSWDGEQADCGRAVRDRTHLVTQFVKGWGRDLLFCRNNDQQLHWIQYATTARRWDIILWPTVPSDIGSKNNYGGLARSLSALGLGFPFTISLQIRFPIIIFVCCNLVQINLLRIAGYSRLPCCH